MRKLFFYAFCLITIGAKAQIEISTASQLQSISLDGNYILTEDIDLSSTTFNPLGGLYSSFSGTLNGNGHTITLGSINTAYTNRGLFSNISSTGRVENLIVKSKYDLKNNIENISYVGGIAARNSGTITNCCSYVSINVSGVMNNNPKTCFAGGVAGTSSGTISYCFANCDIMGPRSNGGTGGIVGQVSNNSSIIQNCVYIGKMTHNYNTTDSYYGMICGNYFSSNYTGLSNNYYLTNTDFKGVGGSVVDDGHCTALSQVNIRALAKTGGVYASTDKTVFKNAILTFPFTVDFQESDGIAFFNSIKGEPANVTFRRTATKNKKCTICLPFDVSQDKLANLGSFYVFSGLKSGTTDIVQMTEVTSGGLKANNAYVFEPNNSYAVGPNDAGIVFNNVTIANSLTPVIGSGTVQFIGTYEAKTWETGDPDLGTVYGFAIAGFESNGFTDGQFVMLGAGASAAPFRAYLKYIPEASSAPRRTPFTIPDVLQIEWISSNNVTNISTVNCPTKENEWFTLDGRKLNGTPSKKGIYVNNGKKVLVK